MTAELDIGLDQGATFITEITITGADNVTPIDLTGATFRSQMRKSYLSPTAYPITVVSADPISGTIQVSLTPIQTAALDAGDYVYDAEYQIAGDVIRFAKGIITVYPRVTR
jgi:hypothetical protein